MSDIYTSIHTISSTEVDKYYNIKTSILFSILQDISMAHFTRLGYGRNKTSKEGLLWIIVNQHAEIFRMPRYEETITINFWCNNSRHMLTPNNFEILDDDGKCIVKASVVWTLMHEDTRTLVNPEDCDIRVSGPTLGTELSAMKGPQILDIEHSSSFTVPYSYIDINGHMNNTRYFDLADDVLPIELHRKSPHKIIVRYSAESLAGELIKVSWGHRESNYYLVCDSEKGNHFKLELEY